MFCKKCGTDAQEANFCPKCGLSMDDEAKKPEPLHVPEPLKIPVAKKKAPKGCSIAVFALLVLLVVIIFIPKGEKGGSKENGGSTQKSEPTVSYIEVSAVTLLEEYDENGVAADAKYKDQLLRVTGVVKSIDKDIMDSAYVTINDGGQYTFISVQCYFAKDKLDSITSLKPGDEITIVGKCSGSSLNVIMKNCSLE